MDIVDLRGRLPYFPGRSPGESGPKTSLTVHWNGPTDPSGDEVAFIEADARFHTTRNWNDDPYGPIVLGDGIMYHELIGKSGTVYLTREPNAILWHCGNEIGNERSRAIQIMVGGAGLVTAAQWRSLARRIVYWDLPWVAPHRRWSATACPGGELTEWVLNQRWKEALSMPDEPVTREELAAYQADVRATLDAMKAVETKTIEALRAVRAALKDI